MAYTLKIFTAEDVPESERERAVQRFRGALEDTLGDAALVLPAEERQAYSPMLAILSAQHEAQYSRLFRS